MILLHVWFPRTSETSALEIVLTTLYETMVYLSIDVHSNQLLGFKPRLNLPLRKFYVFSHLLHFLLRNINNISSVLLSYRTLFFIFDWLEGRLPSSTDSSTRLTPKDIGDIGIGKRFDNSLRNNGGRLSIRPTYIQTTSLVHLTKFYVHTSSFSICNINNISSVLLSYRTLFFISRLT